MSKHDDPDGAAKRDQFWQEFNTQRASESQIAEILMVIANPPNLRDQPADGDLPGRYDRWFDGGAIRQDTGVMTYDFANGTRVLVGSPTNWLDVSIIFPNGESVRIQQDRNGG